MIWRREDKTAEQARKQRGKTFFCCTRRRLTTRVQKSPINYERQRECEGGRERCESYIVRKKRQVSSRLLCQIKSVMTASVVAGLPILGSLRRNPAAASDPTLSSTHCRRGLADRVQRLVDPTALDPLGCSVHSEPQSPSGLHSCLPCY